MGSAPENPWGTVALGGLSACAICLGLLWPLHATAVGARAGIETAITLSAILSLLLLGTRFRRMRQIDDLLLLGVGAAATVCELVFAALPAVVGVNLAATGQAAGRLTPEAGLRVGAFAVLLAVALRRYDEMRRTVAAQALIEERRRLARDLHDGLAQDLAFIAFSAQRLEPDLGPENPLVIAARRALGASRGLIADLAARSAPTTAAALGLIADELGARFDVRVEVRAAGGTAPGGRADLGPSEREEIVLIAREAIVNAAVHGGAQRIDVTLDLDGRRPLLRVSDDGGGITSSAPHRAGALGLPTMRARAESLGGQLVVRRGADRGTELEVRVRTAGAAGEPGPAPVDHARANVASASGGPLGAAPSATSSSPIAARSSSGS